MPEDRSAEVAARLVAGVTALRASRPAEAVEALAAVVDDRELARAEDLVDVRARAASLLAQALLQCGRPAEGLPRVELALRLARQVGDAEGVAEIEQLRETLREAAEKLGAHERDRGGRLATASLDEIAALADPRARAEALLRKANLEAEAARAPTALLAAEQAMALAPGLGEVRIEVLARLVIARVAPERAAAEILAALEAADRADEFNLISTVARAAELHGVSLPVQEGPAMGRRS